MLGGRFSDEGRRLYEGDRDGVLHAALERARVPWCPSCDWALGALERGRGAAADGALSDEADDGAADATVVDGAASEMVASAGGRIWLHALEYRFCFDGKFLRFRTPAPDFVWGVRLGEVEVEEGQSPARYCGVCAASYDQRCSTMCAAGAGDVCGTCGAS